MRKEREKKKRKEGKRKGNMQGVNLNSWASMYLTSFPPWQPGQWTSDRPPSLSPSAFCIFHQSKFAGNPAFPKWMSKGLLKFLDNHTTSRVSSTTPQPVFEPFSWSWPPCDRASTTWQQARRKRSYKFTGNIDLEQIYKPHAGQAGEQTYVRCVTFLEFHLQWWCHKMLRVTTTFLPSSQFVPSTQKNTLQKCLEYVQRSVQLRSEVGSPLSCESWSCIGWQTVLENFCVSNNKRKRPKQPYHQPCWN